MSGWGQSEGTRAYYLWVRINHSNPILPQHLSIDRVSNLKYESVHIDSKIVVFIRTNLGKKETTDGSDSHVNFIRKRSTFP